MDPFIGLIVHWPANFAPQNWQFCAGQLLTIQQYSALYALLGKTYGGDGKTNFALPNLVGRTPMGTGIPAGGTLINPGANAGASTVQLTINNMPQHSHSAAITGTALNVSLQANSQPNSGTSSQPATGYVLSGVNSGDGFPAIYGPVTTDTAPLSGVSATVGGNVTLANTGASAPVSVMQPYQSLNYIIAMQGYWPEHP